MPKQASKTKLTQKFGIDAWLIAALIFCLPFERIPSYEFHHLNLRPSLFVGGAIVLYFLYSLITRRIKLDLTWAHKVLAAFLLWMALRLPAALNSHRAIEVTVFTYFVAAVAVSVAGLLRREYLPLLAKALFISAGLVGIFGLYQYFGNYFGLSNSLTGILQRYSWQVFGYPRVQSTGLEPLYFASYLLLPITLLMTFMASKETAKKAYYPLLFVLTLDLFLTVSRGGNLAFVLFVLAFIPLVWLAKAVDRKQLGMIFLTILLAYLANLVVINYFHHPRLYGQSEGNGLKAYTQQITRIENSGDDRAISRAAAIKIIKKYPLLGIGPGNYGPYEQNNQRSSNGWVIVNNEPLELWAETGIVGLTLVVIFGAIVTVMAWRVLRQSPDRLNRLWGVGLAGYLIAVVVQYQTFSTLYIVHIWTAFGLIIGLYKLYQSKQA